MRYSLIFILSVMLLSFQCSEDEDYLLASQDLIFARVYVNHAWGYSLEGWFIDNDGLVRGFSNHRNPEMNWNEFSSARYLSTEEMNENLMQTDTLFSRINKDSLFKYYRLIPSAAKGMLTEAEARGADMGQISYYALEYLPGEDKYHWILLGSSGDYIVRNTSEEAERILEWLIQYDPLGAGYFEMD